MNPPHEGDQLSQTGKWRAVETAAEKLEREADEHRAAISAGLSRIARHRASLARTARRVLVVDDHELFRKTLQMMLKGDRLDVRVCASGLEALTELGAHEYDVVIVDLDMPGIDGAELVSRIRSMSVRPRCGIIMISGLVEDLAAAAARAEVDAWFAKPLDTGALQEKVEELIARPSQDDVTRPSTPAEEPK